MRNNTNPFILDRINQELFFSLQSVIVKENLDGFIGAILMEPNNGKKMDTMTAYIKKENYINFLNIVKEFSCHES